MRNKNIIFIIFISLISFSVFAESNIDQWEDSEKTYKDLIEEGYEVKAYDISTIKTDSGLILMFFVTVLQKNRKVFECQEYQIFDENMNTISLTFVCRKLVKPFKKGGLGI